MHEMTLLEITTHSGLLALADFIIRQSLGSGVVSKGLMGSDPTNTASQKEIHPVIS